MKPSFTFQPFSLVRREPATWHHKNGKPINPSFDPSGK
jgi:hypothetical protein